MKTQSINNFINSGNIAEVEVSYKSKVKHDDMLSVTCSEDITKVLRSVWSDKIEWVEEMILLLFNRSNKVLGWVKISQGGVSGTICDAKVIFQIALNCNASAFAISHNHPSGNTKPSDADLRLTTKIKQAAKFLDISFIDHVILTADSYYSMADHGEM